MSHCLNVINFPACF